MAFATPANTAASNVSPIGGARQNNENWKSDAFINLYLPTQDGGRRKLGSIGLKLNKPSEAGLIQWLQEDPERINVVLEKLQLDFNMATGSAGSAFAL